VRYRLIHQSRDDYSSSAPSDGSSAASIFESRFMLMAWISAMRCLWRPIVMNVPRSRWSGFLVSQIQIRAWEPNVVPVYRIRDFWEL
jgi:hypothetical protein